MESIRISRRSLLIAALLRAHAQEVTLSTFVDLVNLLATVRNRDGGIVTESDPKMGEAPRLAAYPLSVALVATPAQTDCGISELREPEVRHVNWR